MRGILAACAAFLICGAVTAQTPTEEKASGKPTRPAQTSLAQKGAFGTVAAADAKIKSATKATDLAAAAKFIGKTATFTGTVTKVFAPKSNSLVLLNFADDYKTALVAVVEAKDFAAFPNLQTLTGKKVWLSGKVKDFKGQPEVVLSKRDDIKLIP